MAAEQKFWNTPHLVRLLVPFLDISSMSNLASVHTLTLDLLRQNSAWRRSVWVNLLKKATMEEKVVEDAISLMRLVENNKEEMLLDVLDTICERFPSEAVPLIEQGIDLDYYMGDSLDEVRVTCSRHGEHSVHPEGFKLLEKVESKMGTALQEVFRIEIDEFWKYQDELSQRVRRQQGPIEKCNGGLLKFNIGTFHLLKRSEDWNLGGIEGVNFEEDWAGLGKVCRSGKGTFYYLEDLDVHSVRSARRRDLMSVWCECFGQVGLSEAYSKEEKDSIREGLYEVLGHDWFGEKKTFSWVGGKLSEVEIQKIFGR